MQCTGTVTAAYSEMQHKRMRDSQIDSAAVVFLNE